MCPVSCLSNGNLCYVIDISFPGWVLNLNLKTDVKTCPGISLSGTTEKNESTLRTARQLWFILARWLRLEMEFIVTHRFLCVDISASSSKSQFPRKFILNTPTFHHFLIQEGTTESVDCVISATRRWLASAR